MRGCRRRNTVTHVLFHLCAVCVAASSLVCLLTCPLTHSLTLSLLPSVILWLSRSLARSLCQQHDLELCTTYHSGGGWHITSVSAHRLLSYRHQTQLSQRDAWKKKKKKTSFMLLFCVWPSSASVKQLQTSAQLESSSAIILIVCLFILKKIWRENKQTKI